MPPLPPLLHGPLTNLTSAIEVSGLHVAPPDEQPWRVGFWVVYSDTGLPLGAPKWSTSITSASMTLKVGGLAEHEGQWLIAGHAPFFVSVPAGSVPGPGTLPQPAAVTAWSLAVRVDKAPQPLPPPVLPEAVDPGASCVAVTGVVPGATVQVRANGVLLGLAPGGTAGKVCVPLDWSGVDASAVKALYAWQQKPPLDLATTSAAASCLVRGRLLPLPKPRIVEPVLACQDRVTVTGLAPGAKLLIFVLHADAPADQLGTFDVCEPTVSQRLVSGAETVTLLPGDRVWAGQQRKENDIPTQSDLVTVVAATPADHTPQLSLSLVAAAKQLAATHLWPGASLWVEILAAGSSDWQAAAQWGPVPVDAPAMTIPLALPLVGGQGVRLRQEADLKGDGPCGFGSRWSNELAVLEAIHPVVPPTIIAPMVACQAAVQVSNLHPGAWARVYAAHHGKLTPLSKWVWAENGPSVRVPLYAALAVPESVVAVQCVGGVTSAPSVAIAVEQRTRPYPPRLIEPVAYGDRSVLVSGVTPGALVTVYAGGETGEAAQVLGWTCAAESLVWVDTAPVPATVKGADRVWVTSRLCTPRQVRASARVVPITSAGASHPGAPFGKEVPAIHVEDIALGEFNAGKDELASVKSTIKVQVQGRLYRPASALVVQSGSAGPPSLPLVLIAPGYVPAIANKFIESGGGPGHWLKTAPMFVDGGKPLPGCYSVVVPAGSVKSEFSTPAKNWQYASYNAQVQQDSHLGYAYLAEHLARHGFAVFAVDFDDINASQLPLSSHFEQTDISGLTTKFMLTAEGVGGESGCNEREVQWMRAHTYVRALQLLDSKITSSYEAGQLPCVVDRRRICFVGHSMSGEAAVLAQHLVRTQEPEYSVAAVASIAPMNVFDVEPELRRLKGATYLQIVGGRDMTQASGQITTLGEMIYGDAEGPKSLAWGLRMRHNPFNDAWVHGLDDKEAKKLVVDPLPTPASTAAHQESARALIGAFLVEAAGEAQASQEPTERYLWGQVLPEVVRSHEVVLEHEGSPPVVLGVADFDLKSSGAASPGGAKLDTKIVDLGFAKYSVLDRASALRLTWLVETSGPAASAPSYFWPLQDFDSGGNTQVSLRVAQGTDAQQDLEHGRDLDAFLWLVSDAAGVSGAVRLGAAGRIPYPAKGPKAVMRSLRIPLDAFLAARPELGNGKLTGLALVLAGRPAGQLFLDDVLIEEVP